VTEYLLIAAIFPAGRMHWITFVQTKDFPAIGLSARLWKKLAYPANRRWQI
jgi:hypothetical protein